MGVLIALTNAKAPFPKLLTDLSFFVSLVNLFLDPTPYSPYINGVAVGIFVWASKDIASSFFIKLLSIPAGVYLGKMSYSLYLFHWIYISIALWTIGIGTIEKIAAVFVLTIVSAVLVDWFIERPIKLKESWPSISKSKSLLLIFLIIACSALVNYKIYQIRPMITLSTAKVTELAWLRLYTPNPIEKCATKVELLDKNNYKITIAEDCGVENRNQRIFVLGDSHAMSYTAMLESIVKKTGIDVFMLSKFGGICGLLTGMKEPQINQECRKHVDQSISFIKEKIKPNDIVFLASYRLEDINSKYVGGVSKSRDVETIDIIKTRWSSISDKDLKLLQEIIVLGAQVVIDLPKPIFASVFYRCRESYQKSNEACQRGYSMNRSWLLELRKPVVDAFVSIVKNNPKIRIWDPFTVLCPENSENLCSAIKDEQFLFIDQNHLSAYGNDMLSNSFLNVVIK